MADFLSLHIVGLNSAIATFEGMDDRLHAEMMLTIEMLTGRLKERVLERLTSGNPLHSQSGDLAGSIQSEVSESGTGVVGEVYTEGIPYAAVQEYGGAGAYDIFPGKAKALAFLASGRVALSEALSSGKLALGGDMVFAKHVHHPPLPERSYLRASLADLRSEIFGGFRAAVERAARPLAAE